MFAFRRTRMLIYGVAAVIVLHSTGQAPAILSNFLDRLNDTLTNVVASSEPAGAEADLLGAWTGCEPIAVYVNPGQDGTDRTNLAVEAISRVQQASGVPLIYGGTSTSIPTTRWINKKAPERSITIAWATSAETDLLTTTRIGGANVRTRNGTISAGGIAINSNLDGSYSAGFGPGRTIGNVLVHELTHTLGVGHTEKGTLMYRSVNGSSPDGYTEADLQQLARVQTGC